ncbi:hypothetical protein [Planctellipticum variicoloris]|uniref:hypothetical protein n=1 Tax=Planctellipticum variicoloris TaxID=3064265 RepID=UPI0030134048|nr:hypothetical protein SH412_004862 [Planctomycetaceae bacterium SH412]
MGDEPARATLAHILQRAKEAGAMVSSFSQFCDFVRTKKWTIAEITCEHPPSEELMQFIGCIGLDKYEEWAMEYSKHPPIVEQASQSGQ